MSAIPENYLDLLTQKKAFANLATVMPDGSPQVTPVWVDYRNGRILVNTARGRVARVTEEGADQHIAFLAKKYLGKDKYPWRGPNEVRVLFELEPVSCSSMG